jgi:hypothetical protein
MDDLLLFADDRASLAAWQPVLTERLARLRLHFHPGAEPRPVAEGLGFLGFQVFPHRRRLKRRKAVQYRRHLARAVRAYRTGALEAEAVLGSVLAWNSHAAYGNTLGLRRALFALLPPELAALAAERYRNSRQYRRNHPEACRP